MHESSIARKLLATALDRAAAGGARRVLAVRGWVADAEALSPESLSLHFAAHARGTPAEGARLDLRIERVEARCVSCGGTYAPDHHVLLCPRCGDVRATLVGRAGLGLDAMEVE